MEKNNRYEKIQDERMIGTIDLLLEVARRIWLVVICAVVFAGVLCGYKYGKDAKALQVESPAVSVEEMEAALPEQEKAEIEEVQRIICLLDNLTEYAENSVLMHLDPYNISMASAHFMLDVPVSDENTETSFDKKQRDLKAAYYDYIVNGGLVADLKEAGVETEQKYLREIISVKDVLGSEATSAGTNSFDVQVKYYEEGYCVELADKIAQCILDYQTDLSQRMFAHTVTEISQSYSEIVDKDVLTAQTTCNDLILKYKANVEQLTGELNQKQLMILEKEDNETEVSVEQNASVTSPTISKKYLLLGVAVGIILALVYIIVAYILRGTLNSANDIRYIYNQRVLAEVTVSKQNGFYRFLKKRLLKGGEPLTVDAEKELLVSNIKHLCKRENVNKVLLSFSGNVKYVLGWLPEVQERLKCDNIQVIVLKHGLENCSAVDQMSEIKKLILVEKLFESRYEMFTRELEICMEQEMEILGVVALK